MSNHIHDWKLVDSYDSWKKPKKPVVVNNYYARGGWYPGMANDLLQNINRQVLDTIREGEMPHSTSETWACHCGRRKTNHHETPSIFNGLTGGTDLESKAMSQHGVISNPPTETEAS